MLFRMQLHTTVCFSGVLEGASHGISDVSHSRWKTCGVGLKDHMISACRRS